MCAAREIQRKEWINTCVCMPACLLSYPFHLGGRVAFTTGRERRDKKKKKTTLMKNNKNNIEKLCVRRLVTFKGARRKEE